MAKDKTPLPKVSIIERRVLNPFGTPSVPVTLKTPGLWAIRIVDSTLRRGRLHDIIQNKGWHYVIPEELDGAPAELGFRVLDGRLVRGEHGEEVLVKMSQDDFDRIQQAKADRNLAALGPQKTLESVTQITANKFGDEAGDTVHRRIQVNDSRERVELDEVDHPA